VQNVPQRVRGAAIPSDAGGMRVLGDDLAHRAGGDRIGDRGPTSAQADEQRVGGAPGRAMYQRRSASCTSACNGIVRVRPRFEPRTTTSGGVWSPRLGAIAARRRLSGWRPRSWMSTRVGRASSERLSPAREELEDRAVTDADRHAQIRAGEQPGELEI
jgi:hypothetical protein